MNFKILKDLELNKIAPILFFGLLLFSCGGVHNEPPSEIIRTSGTGSSTSAAVKPANGKTEEATTQPTILDSTGNPINTSSR